MPNLIIGSRGSQLALWQAHWVKSELERLHDGLTVEIEIIKTTGDKLTDASLARMPGKGVFTKEIEEALYNRTIDLAVHSLKDLPTTLPEALHIAAITKREDPRDALVVHRRLASRVTSIMSLPVHPRIGTSSPRRAAQIRHLRPDAQIFELRGNVETRLRKLDEGDLDAIILAAAGLIRLGHSARITQFIPTNHLLPAVGQGALGIETCIEDERTNFLVEGLNDWPTRNAVEAERALLKGLGGGCAVPIAAFGQVETTSEATQLKLQALVCNLTGTKIVRNEVVGSQYKAEEMGSALARHLIAAGAYELLNEERALTPPESSEAPARTVVSPNPGNLAANGATSATPASPPYKPLPTETKVTVTVPNSATQTETLLLPPEDIKPALAPSEEPDLQSQLTFATEDEPVLPPPTEQHGAVTPTQSQLLSHPEATKPALLQPLAGKRILVTRARHQADSLTHSLQNHGAEVILCPTIDIRPPDNWHALDEAISKLRNYHWLVFTSSNGVTHFLRRFDETGHGRAELAALKICAVGKKTAEKLIEEHLQVDLTPPKFTAEDLVAAFIRQFGVGQRMRGTQMLWPAAKTARDVIRTSLEKLGVTVDVVEAYQNVLPDISSEEIVALIHRKPLDYVIFTSPSTVNNLAMLLDADQLSIYLPNARIACIGPVTAKAAEQCGLPVHLMPSEHTAPAIVNLLVKDNSHSI